MYRYYREKLNLVLLNYIIQLKSFDESLGVIKDD